MVQTGPVVRSQYCPLLSLSSRACESFPIDLHVRDHGQSSAVVIIKRLGVRRPSKFVCHISPAIVPGEAVTISNSCRGGQFVHDHYWRQAVPRYTRHLTLNIRHHGVDMLLNCTAIEEQADGSEVSATEDLICADDSGDAVITLTRNYLQPSQAVTLRWEISRASS